MPSLTPAWAQTGIPSDLGLEAVLEMLLRRGPEDRNRERLFQAAERGDLYRKFYDASDFWTGT